MKTRFSSEDIIAITSQLQPLIGMRVNQIYDVDSKTYLLKLNRYDEKITLLLESGIRIHTTEFEWPKSPAPSGFSMKLRKHIKNKRLEKISQLGTDRIINLQFGINDAAYHLILELYDRGNLILTDFEYTILNLLRPRTDNTNEDVKFIVRERYPIEIARQNDTQFLEKVHEALASSKAGDNVKKILLTSTPFGPSLIDHLLQQQGFMKNASIGKGFDPVTDTSKLVAGLENAHEIVKELSKENCPGYIVQKEEQKVEGKIFTNIEYHPYLFRQIESLPYVTYASFDKAVDNYFSNMEAQRIDSKAIQKEKEAMKKLSNVKKDHEKRLNKLLEEQNEDIHKAELIELNLDQVEAAITVIRSAVANQISWTDIWDLIQEAQMEDEPVAKAIKKLKLEINHFTMFLNDSFKDESGKQKGTLIDIDLDLSAYGNARKYYDKKRFHAKKEQKTLEASEKAFKNAEKRTKQALKEVAVITMITKARKPMWFEKFIWFISSENYLVIAGRDIQQNEVIVKRYMKSGDVYVHADIHGASSVVVKNPSRKEIPPKTLNEAGTFSVCYSSAWDAKILTSAWWVYHHQVSKTAPTGEYLTAGSFMIRGKKNYLLPSQLVLGFGFLFKLSEDSLERHEGERKDKQDGSEVAEEPEVEEDIPVDSQESEDDEAKVPSDYKETGNTSENKEPEENDVPNSEANLVNSTKDIDVNNDKDTDVNNDKDTDVNNDKDTDITNDKDADVNNDIDTDVNNDDEQNISDVFFPDTKIELRVYEQNKTETHSSRQSNNTTLIIAAEHKTANKQSNATAKSNASSVENIPITKQSGPKRGQKARLKKIKEKYKDQDEEERALKMKILASAGEPKPDKKKKKGKGNKISTIRMPQQQVKVNIPEKSSNNNLNVTENEALKVDSDEEDEEIDSNTSEEVNLLSTLTGVPTSEDTLLYAVPVCAPYSSILNYKYKVKLAPGTGKRGKAGKTALGIFLHEKSATQREKDCLRSVKDQDVSRNFPGKVKLWHTYGKKK